MLRPDDLEDTWQLLESDSILSSELQVRQLDNLAIAEVVPLFAMDNFKRRQILIPVTLNQKSQEDIASSGIQILSRKLEDAGKLQQYVVIICQKPHLNELFSIIVTEILNLLVTDSNSPAATAKKVLEQWRELLEKDFSLKPDLSIIIGLFGELWILRKLTEHNSSSVFVWRGPEGARHDFVGANQSLEVKASLARQGRFVVIHGYDQLEPISGNKLFLAVLKLERREQSGENLLDLVKSITEKGVDKIELFRKIARLGFTNKTLEVCDDMHFEVKETLIYLVESPFPRIISSSFMQGKLPSGVIKLDYTIDLSNEPPFPLDEKTVESLYKTFTA